MNDRTIISIYSNRSVRTNARKFNLPPVPEHLKAQLKKHEYNSKVASRMIARNGDIINIKDDHNVTAIHSRGGNREGDEKMSPNDNFDTFFKELKEDMRERESRTREEIQNREKRFEDTLNKYHQENKEREDRIMAKLDGMEQRVDNQLSNMTQRIDSVHGRVDSLKYWVIGSVITLLLGVGGLVYANWQVISTMLSLIEK